MVHWVGGDVPSVRAESIEKKFGSVLAIGLRQSRYEMMLAECPQSACRMVAVETMGV